MTTIINQPISMSAAGREAATANTVRDAALPAAGREAETATANAVSEASAAPTYGGYPVARDSRLDKIDSLLEAMRARLERADAVSLQAMLDRLVGYDRSQTTKTAETSGNEHDIAEAINMLTQGRRYSPEETLLMELEMQRRAFDTRRELLKGALTSTEVARLLGTQRQTPHDRLKSGTLLGIEENGRWMFPYWQFDASGPNGVVCGLPETLRALQISAIAKAKWLTLSNAYLEGRTPLAALKDGDIARVVDTALAVGAN